MTARQETPSQPNGKTAQKVEKMEKVAKVEKAAKVANVAKPKEAKRQGLEKAVEAKQSVPWANLYKKVRSMLVGTGASGSLSYKDAGGYLVGATPSA